MSYDSHDQARRAAKRLIKRFKGKGWTHYIWKNMGWHLAFHNGALTVYPHEGLGGVRFSALHSDRLNGTGGLACWTPGHKEWKDPNRAAKHATACARCYIDSLDAVVRRSERIYVRKSNTKSGANP